MLTQLNDINHGFLKVKNCVKIDFFHKPRDGNAFKNKQHFNLVYQLSSSVEIKRMKKK